MLKTPVSKKYEKGKNGNCYIVDGDGVPVSMLHISNEYNALAARVEELEKENEELNEPELRLIPQEWKDLYEKNIELQEENAALAARVNTYWRKTNARNEQSNADRESHP
jgi:predicted nuclease with TOPRIM domain